jgi:hypothetical protein
MTASFFLRRCLFGILLPSFGLLARADTAALSFPPVDGEPLGTVSAGAIVLHDNWQMREEAIVGDHGDTFSSPSFDTKGWYPATVPTTALATLARNGVYPDPIMGTNMMKIPDVNEAENTRYNLMQYSHLPDHSNPFDRPYWFRTSFTLPASYSGETVWLHLDGINYRADVWLNGQQIANANDVVGMFKRFRFDISKFAKTDGTPNTLAVRIHQLDVPGDPVLEQLGGVYGAVGPNAGDRTILDNVTMYQTVGWDWTPSVRDRNMGIWQHVWLEATGPVAVRDPAGFVDLKWTPGQDAPIKVRGYLDNPGTQPVSTDLKVRITPEGFDGPAVEFTQNVSAAPGRNEFILLPTDHPELVMHNPKVWWPVTYGDHPLYTLTVSASVNGKASSSASSLLGVRTVGTFVLASGGRAFTCNGRTIRFSGGAWIPDTLLSWSAQRYRDEVRLMAEGNETVVRVNGCGIMPPDVFFDACDRNGLLVWEDFSRTSPFMVGEVDTKLLMDNMVDCVDRMRGHPSLLLWEGANEAVPPQAWAEPMQNQVLPAMDGTRPWMLSSSGNAHWGVPLNHMSSGGPYRQEPLRTLFDLYAHAPYMTCKNEIGMAAPMNINSVVQSIPDWDQTDDKNFPLNVTFGFHDALTYYVPTHTAIAEQFGPMPDLMEYLWIGDLFHGEFYRGVYEAANKVRPRNEGTHLWKVNASWPSMMWELFDWYLHPNSGYYGMKEALKPIHVQYSIDDSGVQVVSTEPDALTGAKVHAEIVSLQGVTESTKDFTVDVAADATTPAGSLADQFADGQAKFLALTLTTAEGKVLDHDVRWVADDDVVWELQTMAPATVMGTVKETHVDGAETVDTLGIENTSNVPACDVRSEILSGPQGGEVLPSFWTDNALTLLPHEKREVTVRYRTALLAGAEPHFIVEGFNVMPSEINVADGKVVPLAIKLVACESVPARNGKPTVKLTYVNAGTAGSRYTSWPIPLAVDGQVVRYAHVDVSGSKETSQTVSFADLLPGDHEVKAGFPDLAATQGSVKVTATPLPVQFVPPPVKTLASSETPGMEASHLFDGNLSPDSIGKATDLGGIYLAAPKDDARVIWTDYGAPIKANGLAFAQPPSSPAGANHTTRINVWFYPTDPGGGPVVPKVTKHGPDEVITLQWHNDSLLRAYPFSHPRAGQFVVMQLVGYGASVGASELRLIAQ